MKELKNYKISRKLFFLMAIFIGSKTFSQTNLQWAHTLGSVIDEGGRSITYDASGNSFTTGGFAGTLDFDPGPAVFNLTAVTGNDVFVTKKDPSGALIWAVAMGGSGSDQGVSIAVDPTGNVYLTGQFAVSMDFDPGPGVFTIAASGQSDIFISKLSSTGTFVWAKKLGGANNEYSTGLVLDAFGNVYTTGYFTGLCDFDPGTGVFNRAPVGSSDIFVNKLSSGGTFIWTQVWGGTGPDNAHAICLDAMGNIYVTGFFVGTSDFNPGTASYTITASGIQDVFINKLDVSGNFVWAKKLGGSNVEIGNAIKIDGAGNIYTAGNYSGTVDFDPGAGTYSLTSVGAEDVFISKLSSAGNFIWAKSFGGVGTEAVNSLKLDPSGDVYTSGYFNDTVDFNPSSSVFNLGSVGGDDVFISKMDSSGSFVWASKLGGTGSDRAIDIAVDGSGFIYMAGYFKGTSDFNPGVATYTLTANGGYDIFTLKLCQTLSQPSVIDGSILLCAGSAATYSVSLDNDALSYTWMLPNGWSGSSSTNTISTITSSDGIISVTADNSCGNSLSQILYVAVDTILPAPAFISGPTVACEATTNSYSISPFVDVSSYNWSFPGGWAGTSNTNSITLTVDNSGGSIYVNAINACGPGGVQTLSVNVSLCTGIQETKKKALVEVYPNPVKSVMTLQSVERLFSVVVYNSLGEILILQQVDEHNAEIDLSNLNSGIYFLKMEIENKAIIRKVIKE